MERFWSKVNKTQACWEWTAALTPNGYGRFRDGRSVRVAHRVSYERLVGMVPEGLELDHLCRNRRCVNPAHLEPVTRQVNAHRGDGIGGVQARLTHCKRGHPLSGPNLYVQTNGTRRCLQCNVDRYQRRKLDAAEEIQPGPNSKDVTGCDI